MAAAVPDDVDVNPDLLLAQQILAGLVRGTDACPETFNGGFVHWAVSVLRTAAGDVHTVVASSLGGGAYVPSGVYVPVAVRLASLDPVLPWGWAQRFMGWQSGADIVAAHADELAARTPGVRRSALATSM